MSICKLQSGFDFFKVSKSFFFWPLCMYLHGMYQNSGIMIAFTIIMNLFLVMTWSVQTPAVTFNMMNIPIKAAILQDSETYEL